MLAITIAITAIAVPMVLGESAQVVDPAPDANFAFAYTEDVSGGEPDSLGATATDTDPDADGKITIVLETGDSIPVSELNLTGTASSGPLGDSEEFDEGDTVESGSSVTVWANRGDTLRVIWTSSDEKDSSILGEFTVRPTE